MAFVSAGIVMTNATSSTSMTSTSGVMLISLSTSVSSEVETAISIAPLDTDRLQAVDFLRAPIGAQHGMLCEVQEVVGEVVEVRGDRLHSTHEEVESEHRGNGDRDADARGDQRFADGARDHVDGGVADAADVLHRGHDSPDRPEQTHEWRCAADAGEYRETTFQGAPFT